MQEWATKLLALQEIDLQAAKLSQQLVQLPARQKESETLYAAEAKAYADAKQALQTAELTLKKLSSEETEQTRKKREFQQKTTQIKRNEEYKDAMEQLKHFDEAISKLEDQQLELMEKIEAAKVLAASKKKAFDLAEKRVAGVKSDLAMLQENCKKQLEELKARRPAAVAAVDPALLRQYDHLRSNRNANPLLPCAVPVISESCGRCHMKVSPHKSQLASKGEVVYCENCGAILYEE